MYLILLIILHLDNICANGNMIKESCEIDDNFKMTCYNCIPKDIPDGITAVHIAADLNNSVQIERSNFSSVSWSNVKMLELSKNDLYTLTLGENCFRDLKLLKQLRLNVSAPLHISTTSFFGLDSVEVLDMTGCSRIYIQDFLEALNISNTLPALNKLVLSGWRGLRAQLILDETFLQMLLPRKITMIDLSNSQILDINITAGCKLEHLEVVNASYTIVNNLSDRNLTQNDLKHIKSLDISHITLPKKTASFIPGSIKLYNLAFKYDKLRYDHTFLFTPETVNLSGIIPFYASIWIENCTLIVNKDPSWFVKTLISRHNNLRRINGKFLCDDYKFTSIETLDVSENGIEFLHPSFLTCIPNIVDLDMSKNKLFKMIQENFLLFENLFRGLKYLKSINFSANELHNLPPELFYKSKRIEIINLSYNMLDQVTFTLSNLDNLQVLDLQGNNIRTLDSISLNYLNSIPKGENVISSKATVIFKGNPISCSGCETKDFIQWLLSSHLVGTRSNGLHCHNENNVEIHINSDAAESVQKICNRKTLVISACVSAAIIALVVITCITIFHYKNKSKKKEQNRANVLRSLQDGDGQFEFAVFLSYSNNDEDFVNAHIIHKLNEKLQLMIGVNRNLVCTGDCYFRPGFYVHNETYRQLDKVSVVISVVSNNFCASDYCCNELDQAYVKRKPIVLMFIEHVDEEIMTPTLKELYRRNVRILWTVEDGQCVLKTSWENVCTSILDVIKSDI